jgi:integrase
MRLKNALVSKAAKGEAAAGKYRDGKNGLLLIVRDTGSASWAMRYMHQGRRRDLGLGSVQHVGLAQARTRAAELMGELKGKRIDPLAERTTERQQQRSAAVTFDQAARHYIEAHKAGWRDKRGAETWTNTLASYASPVIGSKRVGEVTTDDVLKILTPLWQRIPETGARVRGRIESVLDFAKARGWRDGENCARWRGHLANMLPRKSKVSRTRHHAAVPLEKLPATFANLWDGATNSAAAAAFCILTAARPGEAAGALWSEIDLGSATWVLPAHRTKQGQIHRVPLSPAAVELLRRQQRRKGEARVFPSDTRGDLSLSSLLAALREAAGDPLVTLHGTARSGLDDWASANGFSTHLIDRALGHAVGDATRRAYRRSDLLAERRPMMTAWAKFLAG